MSCRLAVFSPRLGRLRLEGKTKGAIYSLRDSKCLIMIIILGIPKLYTTKACGFRLGFGIFDHQSEFTHKICSGVRLDHASCSRQHLEVECQRGEVILRDLGSTHGTWLKQSRGDLRLEQGSAIRLSEDFQIRFVCLASKAVVREDANYHLLAGKYHRETAGFIICILAT